MDPLLEAFFNRERRQPPTPQRTSMEDTDAKWNKIKSSEAVPRGLVDALYEMTTTNKHMKTEIDQLRYHNANLVAANNRFIMDVDAFRHRLNSSPFVILLIDGDATQFSDDFVTSGVPGGHKAAHSLQQALADFMERKLGLPTETKIVIRVYMNATGLKAAYVAAGVLPQQTMLWEFAQAFNRELPLAEWVDCGSDKEAADNKIKANIDLFWRHENCKHMLLAGSADRGYVNYLRQFSYRMEDRSRLTLIETKPYPHDFKELASLFGNAQGFFQGIFRLNHLVSIRGHAAPKAQLAPTWATILTPKTPAIAATPAPPFAPIQSPPPLALATPVVQAHNKLPAPAAVADTGEYTTAQGSSRPQSPASSASDWIPVQRAQPPQRIPILLNKKNQRVHKPLEPYDSIKAATLKLRHLCPYKILTRCTRADCEFMHDNVNLSDLDRRNLIYIHRITPCPRGFECRDRNCVSGHYCLFDESCLFRPCKYSKEQHFVDKVVAREI